MRDPATARSGGRPSDTPAHARYGVVEGGRFFGSARSQANHPFGASAPLGCCVAHPGFQEAFALEAIESCVERTDRATARDDFLDLLTNRSAIGVFAEARRSGQQQSTGGNQGRPSLDGGTMPLIRRNAPMMPYISLSCEMFQFSSPSLLMSQRAHFTLAAPAVSVIDSYTGSQ